MEYQVNHKAQLFLVKVVHLVVLNIQTLSGNAVAASIWHQQLPSILTQHTKPNFYFRIEFFFPAKIRLELTKISYWGVSGNLFEQKWRCQNSRKGGHPIPILFTPLLYCASVILKLSQNKKDLNDITAALFSVSFSQLPVANKYRKRGSCDVIKVFLILWWL